MFLKVFIFLFLAAECKGNIFCNFKKSLCSWSNAYSCHFQHETEKPLAGKKGYLQISKNTCNLAAISTSTNSAKRFRFNYFLNGTGQAMIYVYADYSISSREIIWQCTANQGPKWKAAEIQIKYHGWFDSLKNVIIEVETFEDVTVAIGNIEPPKNGHIEHICPPSPPIIKPTTKIPRMKTTKPTTPLVNPGNTHTMCNFKYDLCQWRDIYHNCHFKHVKDTPLLEETGYLMLSKDTCKHATLLVRLKEFKFQLHYLMNGTGNMSLSVGVHYGFAGRDQLWSCSTSQGPKWNKLDITVQLIHFDPVVNVYIDASVSGDATIAIGNIAKAENNPMQHRCPPSPSIIKPKTKIPRMKTTKPTTPLVNTGNTHTMCNFKFNLCQWRDIYHNCHFKHVKDTPLLGETGYLMLSKDTCKHATLLVRLKEFKFQLHYLMNGTGNMSLSVGVHYGFAGRDQLWSCRQSQGPKWNKVDITVQLIHFDPVVNVYIDASVIGDATIAIGNIAKAENNPMQHRCPPSPSIIKPTTKIPRMKTTKPTTPLVNTGNTHTMCNFKFNLCQWRDIYHKCHFKHVKATPLLGETGYLMLSKDTCKHATLLVRLKEFKFQLHYLMNGTGNMSLNLGVHYGFAGRDQLWSCSTSQGLKWNKVDITVQLIHFDPVVNIYIDASVSGDATIAIGNIAKAGDGSKEKQCQSRSRNLKTSLEFSTT